MNPNSITWQYIAVFFDGEGSCGLYTSEYGLGTCRATIAQSDPSILKDIKDFCDSHGIHSLLRITTKGTSLSPRPCYRLEFFGKNAPLFLSAIHPYLKVKKVKAQDIVRFKQLFPPLPRKSCGKRAAETRWGWQGGAV